MDCRGEDSQVMEMENHFTRVEENNFHPGAESKPQHPVHDPGCLRGCGRWGLIQGHGAAAGLGAMLGNLLWAQSFMRILGQSNESRERCRCR